jgi:hypothetical protein
MVARALKVFRTPIGFHDAYVAAASQKAALAAWGSDHNLFARGEAELVDDPALTAEPLAHPGKIIKRSRGSTAEQLAALAPHRPRGSMLKRRSAPKPPKPKPRPDRTALDAAESLIAAARERHARDRKSIEEEEARLAKRRVALEKAQTIELARLERDRLRAKAPYDRAMTAWRAD